MRWGWHLYYIYKYVLCLAMQFSKLKTQKKKSIIIYKYISSVAFQMFGWKLMENLKKKKKIVTWYEHRMSVCVVEQTSL